MKIFQTHSALQNFITCWQYNCAMTIIVRLWRHCRGSLSIAIRLISDPNITRRFVGPWGHFCSLVLWRFARRTNASVGDLDYCISIPRQFCEWCPWMLSQVDTHAVAYRLVQALDEQRPGLFSVIEDFTLKSLALQQFCVQRRRHVGTLFVQLQLI